VDVKKTSTVVLKFVVFYVQAFFDVEDGHMDSLFSLVLYFTRIARSKYSWLSVYKQMDLVNISIHLSIGMDGSSNKDKLIM
jgi:hypothetical protein